MDYSRRDFLRLSGAASVFSILATTGGCQTIFRSIANRPTRKILSNLSASHPDIQTYRAAVRQLRNRTSRPTWRDQANIHRDHCPHGNWYFLPWHRAYLYHFEEICRHLTGNDDFALPYWNWSINPTIPSTFWGSGNPLDHSRAIGPGDAADPSAVGPARLEAILQSNSFIPDIASGRSSTQRGFTTFGELEGGPHNYIHGFVGEDMSTISRAAQDPIFWCNHGMVDCLWVDWNIDRGNSNSNDPQWTGHTFTGFVDPQGNPVTTDVQETLLMPLLAYQYEDSQKGTEEAVTSLETEQLKEAVRRGADVRLDVRDRFAIQQAVEVSVGEPATLEVNVDPRVLRAVPGTQRQNRLFLTVRDVRPPRNSDFFVRVFLNRPNATRESSFDDPAFAGTFAFFTGGEVQDDETGRGDYVLNVTDEVVRLRERGELEGEPLTVRLIATPFRPGEDPTDGSFTLEGIELALASPAKTEEDTEADSLRS